MKSRIEIRQHIIKSLELELSSSLCLSENELLNVLNNPKIKSKIELEADDCLISFEKEVITQAIKEEIKKISEQLNVVKIQLLEKITADTQFIQRNLINSDIQGFIPTQIIQFDKKRLKELISKNETELVIDISLKFTKEKFPKIFNEIIMQYSKLNQLSMEIRIGNINKEQERIERANINKSLIEIIDMIE
jgi:hypothetical protein